MTRARTLLGALLLAACATTGAEGEGSTDLPTAGVGPFRRFADAEVRGIAPFVVDDRDARYREPAAVVDDGAVVLFAVASSAAGDVVVRTRATDARSFYGVSGDLGRAPRVVLSADRPWEGASLSGPAVLRRGDAWLLYYAAAAGIGVARSSDGLVFQKEPSPVLAGAPAPSWESTPPRAPAAYLLPDGRVRLFYAAGAAIGEAESPDGVAPFQRLDADPSTPAFDPVLGPATSPGTGSELAEPRPPFDAAGVSDPAVLPRITAAGRFHVRVLYTGRDASGATAIGFAARYGDHGPLVRQSAPVYAAGAHEDAPTFVDFGGHTFLYVGQDRRLDASHVYPAVAGAVAPATAELPPPEGPPDSP